MKLENLKNVLLISHELSMTGAPIALQYLARQLRQDGVFTVILSPKDGPLRMEIIKEDFTVVIDDSITGSAEWLKWARGFDMIVVNTVVIFHVINQLSGMDIPVLWWVHDGEMSFQLGANELLPQKIGHNVTALGGGGYAKKILDKYRPEYQAGELIYCVPDFTETLDDDLSIIIDKKGKEILFSSVGSIDVRKGQDILEKAIRCLSDEYIERCHFLFVGRAGDEKVYQAVKKLQQDYPSNVTMITEVSRKEIRDIYRQSDVVVCTSRDDPMPVFMTESLMLSRPVICSEYTGTYSLITNNKNGLVYHSNSAEELAVMLKFAIDNPEKMKDIGRNGRKVYEEHFTEDAFRDKLYKIIENK